MLTYSDDLTCQASMARKSNTVSRSQLAKLFNISPNRVSELKEAGIIGAVSERPLRFDPADCKHRFGDYKKKDATRLAQSGNREQLEARLRLHKSNLVKQRNKLNSLKEQVVTIADTERAYNAFRGVILQELRQLPEQITDKLGSTKDMANAAEAIEGSVHAALRRIQGKLTEYCDAYIGAGESPDTLGSSSTGVPLIEAENADLVAEIRTVRTQRDHVVAEANEIVADLFSGNCVYASDIERVLGDRSVSARSKLLGLPQLLARVVLGTGSRAAGHLTEAIEQIAAEIKPFDAADFRAKEVRDRSSEPDGAEPDEEV
jgi:phage terminase Nu1 subunit (DNA packaging protein)